MTKLNNTLWTITNFINRKVVTNFKSYRYSTKVESFSKAFSQRQNLEIKDKFLKRFIKASVHEYEKSIEPI